MDNVSITLVCYRRNVVAQALQTSHIPRPRLLDKALMKSVNSHGHVTNTCTFVTAKAREERPHHPSHPHFTPQQLCLGSERTSSVPR